MSEKIPVMIDGEEKLLSPETIKGLTTDLGYEVVLKSKGFIMEEQQEQEEEQEEEQEDEEQEQEEQE